MTFQEIKKLECWNDGVFYTEEWKEVEGYEKSYLISSFGRIASKDKIVTQKNCWGRMQSRVYKGKMLKQIFNKYGYASIELNQQGKPFTTFIHRLVAKAFIPNPENKPCVNHLFGNKLDNRFFMLEWVTYSENMIHAVNTGLYPIEGKSKFSKPILQFSMQGDFIKRWHCVQQIKRELGLSIGCIASCARGERPTAHGFKWKREVLSNSG